MNFKEQTMEEYFLGLTGMNGNNKFPSGVDYIGRYRGHADILYKEVHPEIEKGAMIVDGGCLTNHGEKHIKTVILRATQLLSGGVELSPYELYVLLMAIHLHDIGNLTGRKRHEQKINSVTRIINNLCFEDEIEKECILDIAGAHGGDNSKMANLHEKTFILDQPVRPRLLASILRLADEISDDHTRANKTLLMAGTLPEESQIFHRYSYALKTARYIPDSKIISYKFCIDEQDLVRKFPKKIKGRRGKDVYLIDEIYERTMKTFLELTFCSKFFRPHVEVNQLRVYIEIRLGEKDQYGNSMKRIIQYDISDLCYPNTNLKYLCPGLDKLTGTVVAQQLTDKTFENVNLNN